MNQTLYSAAYHSLSNSSPSSVCSNGSHDRSDKSDVDSTDEDDLAFRDCLPQATSSDPRPHQWNIPVSQRTTRQPVARWLTSSRYPLPFLPSHAIQRHVATLLSRSQTDVNQRLLLGDYVTVPKNLPHDQVIDIYGEVGFQLSILDLQPASWTISHFNEQVAEIGAQFLETDCPKLTTRLPKASGAEDTPLTCHDDTPLQVPDDSNKTLAHNKECGHVRDKSTQQVPNSHDPPPALLEVVAPSTLLPASPNPFPQTWTDALASWSANAQHQAPVATPLFDTWTSSPQVLWACPFHKRDPTWHHVCRNYNVTRIDSVYRFHIAEKHKADLTPEITSRIEGMRKQPTHDARWKAYYEILFGVDSAHAPSPYWTKPKQDIGIAEISSSILHTVIHGGLEQQEVERQVRLWADQELGETAALAYKKHARTLELPGQAFFIAGQQHNIHPGQPQRPPESGVGFLPYGGDIVPNTYTANAIPEAGPSRLAFTDARDIRSLHMEHVPPFPNHSLQSPYQSMWMPSPGTVDSPQWNDHELLTTHPGYDGTNLSHFPPPGRQQSVDTFQSPDVTTSWSEGFGVDNLKAPTNDSGYTSGGNLDL